MVGLHECDVYQSSHSSGVFSGLYTGVLKEHVESCHQNRSKVNIMVDSLNVSLETGQQKTRRNERASKQTTYLIKIVQSTVLVERKGI